MRITPGIVVDWQLSKHSVNEVGCSACHGDLHNSMTDPEKAGFATPDVCSKCHSYQVQQFGQGKHALAWGAMKAMPSLHRQAMSELEGQEGCGGCHRIGLKTEEEVKELAGKGGGFGLSSCDVCHTRHVFSTDEARSPQACRTCHMGVGHPQWEMFSSSKHGVRFLLKQSRMLPEDAAAPTCQSCHLAGGNHANRTAWGYMAVRLPYPDDEQWARDRATIMQALGLFDSEGKPTERFGVLEKLKFMSFAEEDWKDQREKELKVCNDCHSINFAKAEFDKGDRMIREADGLLAEGIRAVAALYRDGILKKPENYFNSFPDLLAMYDAPTAIEQKLFAMFHEYRMNVFQGAFHSSPDHSLWYGWAAMKSCLVEIRERAAEMRAAAGRAETPTATGEIKPGVDR
jgi:hydroxylamine dehydrogenase